MPNELLGKIWNGKYKGQKQTWFLAKFMGEDEEINIKQKKAEFYDWRWAEPLELPKLIVPFKNLFGIISNCVSPSNFKHVIFSFL